MSNLDQFIKDMDEFLNHGHRNQELFMDLRVTIDEIKEIITVKNKLNEEERNHE